MLQPDLHGNKTFLEHGVANGEIPSYFAKDDTCGPSVEAAKDDEAQLQEAVLEEAASASKKKTKKSRYQLERYASKIAKMGHNGKEEFYIHLGRRLREAGEELLVVVALRAVCGSHQVLTADLVFCCCRHRAAYCDG